MYYDTYMGMSVTIIRFPISINTICSLVLCLFVILVVSHFGFKGGSLVLIAPVSGNYLSFTF